MIPAKKSKKWIAIFLFYVIMIFAVFLTSRVLLGQDSVRRSMRGILVLTLCTALIPCIAGYFGKRIFFITFSISVLIGLIYAFYTIVADIAPGWGDLTSLLGYVFITGIGLIVAINAELIHVFINYRRRYKM